MKTYIVNFGHKNYLWPACHARSTIAMSEDEDLRPFQLGGDRSGYIKHCLAHKKTASGNSPNKQVASRWFNLPRIVADSERDLWIHREKDELWWTMSRPGKPDIDLVASKEPHRAGGMVYVAHKAADEWSNRSRKGARLTWDSLHPCARAFLFAQNTLHKLSDDNAAYAHALIDGADLTPWHFRPEWAAKA